MNFLEVLRETLKKGLHFKNFCALKRTTYILAILRNAIKKGLLLRNLGKKSPLFKISTQIFLKIRGGSTPPFKIQGGLRPPQPPLLWRPCYIGS